MASRTSRRDQKQALVDRLEQSRRQLGRDVGALAQSVDVPSRLRKSIAQHPLKLAAGATLAGLAGASLLRRPRAIGRGFGLLRSLFIPSVSLAIDLFRRRSASGSPPAQTAGSESTNPRPPLAERVVQAVLNALK